MKITVLMDNIAPAGLLCEWGLSFFIEYEGKNYLLDMGGTGDFMIGDLIEGQIHSQNNNLPVAAALSAVLMAIILVSMLILNRFTENDEGGSVLI